MEFRVPVGTLERSIVSRVCVENAHYQEVEAKHVQFVLRTKDIGRVRLTSSTTQNLCIKEYYGTFRSGLLFICCGLFESFFLISYSVCSHYFNSELQEKV